MRRFSFGICALVAYVSPNILGLSLVLVLVLVLDHSLDQLAVLLEHAVSLCEVAGLNVERLFGSPFSTLYRFSTWRHALLWVDEDFVVAMGHEHPGPVFWRRFFDPRASRDRVESCRPCRLGTGSVDS
jgi:hypothetical protein